MCFYISNMFFFIKLINIHVSIRPKSFFSVGGGA